MNDYTPSLNRLALLAQKRSGLLAGPLALYQEQEGLTDQQLADRLRCDVQALPKLALCERPRQASHFREDVERIAQYIDADMIQLAKVLRAVESRETLRQGTHTIAPTLLAARDHQDDDSDAEEDKDEVSDE